MKGLPKTTWLVSAVLIGTGSAAQLRVAGAQSATAVLTAPSGGRLTPHGAGTWQIGTTSVFHGLQYRISATDADVPALLKALGEASHTHIIVSDDVHARLPYLNLEAVPVATILQQIAVATHLAVGKVGTDTYLVVNAPAVADRAPVALSPFSNPVPPYAPRVEPVPMPGSNAKRDPHHNWSPRTFNGMTYYMIPLGPDATAATAAPELPDLTSSLLHSSVPAAPPALLSPGAITPAK